MLDIAIVGCHDYFVDVSELCRYYQVVPYLVEGGKAHYFMPPPVSIACYSTLQIYFIYTIGVGVGVGVSCGFSGVCIV